MSYTWKGITSTNVSTGVYNLPMVLENFRLVNNAGSSITANVYLIDGSGARFAIAPVSQTINQNTMYSETNTNIVVLATEQVNIQVSGSCSFAFTFDNTEATDVE